MLRIRHIAAITLGATITIALGVVFRLPPEPEALTLEILIWNDYINPNVVSEFEQANQCKVNIRTYASNEELETILDSSMGEKTDIIVPSSYALPSLYEKGYIQRLDPRKLPNLRHLDPEFIEKYPTGVEPEQGVPYLFAPTGFCFITTKPRKSIGTFRWQEFDDFAFAKSVPPPGLSLTILDDKREAIAAALCASGIGPNDSSESATQQARKKLQSWKEAKISFDGESYVYRVLAGDIVYAQAYAGDVLPLTEGTILNEDHIEFLLPETEHIIVTCDYLSIPKKSRNTELAHRFIDFICTPDISRKNMLWVGSIAPNAEACALIDKETLKGGMQLLFDRFGPPWQGGGTVLKPLSSRVEEDYDIIWNDICATIP